MKLNLELDRNKLALIRKMIKQIKQACPSQQIYITFDDEGIKLISEYNAHDLQYVDAFFNLGIEYFVSSKTLESKRLNNLICVKIKDFQQFATNFSSIVDNSSSVTLVLSKDGDNRFIKIKSTENEVMQTITRSEIYLHFDDLSFPRIDEKKLFVQVITRDLFKLLEICVKREQKLYVKMQCEKGFGRVSFNIQSPQIEIIYDNIEFKDYNEQELGLQEGQVFEQTFVISEKHAKQLSVICGIDENVNLGIMKDNSLSLEFWELNENQLIIAMKSFVVPQLDDLDFSEKIEEEQDQQQLNQDNEQNNIPVSIQE